MTQEHMAIIKFPINSPARILTVRAENGEFQIQVMTRAISQDIQKYCNEGQLIDVEVMPPEFEIIHEAERSEKAVEGNYRV